MGILGADLVVSTWVAALAGAILHPAGLSDVALRVSGLPATSTTTEVSAAAWASRPAIMTTGATATPTTIPTAVILPGTDVRQHQRPNKPRIVFAGPVPIDAALAGCMFYYR